MLPSRDDRIKIKPNEDPPGKRDRGNKSGKRKKKKTTYNFLP